MLYIIFDNSASSSKVLACFARLMKFFLKGKHSRERFYDAKNNSFRGQNLLLLDDSNVSCRVTFWGEHCVESAQSGSVVPGLGSIKRK